MNKTEIKNKCTALAGEIMPFIINGIEPEGIEKVHNAIANDIEKIINEALQPKNYHILIIKDIHATNHLPARVQIISERRKESVTISYSNEPGAPNSLLGTAEKYLKERGFEIIGSGEGKHEFRNTSDYLISTTFDKSIK